jgi:hypothetical protein
MTLQIILLVAFSLALFILSLIEPSWFKRIKISKENLAMLYGVSKKTLNKWLSIFAKEFQKIYGPLRKLGISHISSIIAHLGMPENRIFTKKYLRDECGLSNYKFNQEASVLGYELIDPAEMLRIDIFPPSIGRDILDKLRKNG